MKNNFKGIVSKDSDEKKFKQFEMSNSFIAGAIAGICAKTAIAPLDRAKINFQVRNVRFSYKECILFVVDSFKRNGFRSLYRGNMAQVMRVAPAAAVNYTAFGQWCKLIGADRTKHDAAKTFVCGALAGVTATMATYPLDLMRAKMAVTDKSIYPSTSAAFRSVFKTEGLSGFYRGVLPTLIGSMPYYGIGYTTYITLKIVNKELFNDPDPNKLKRLVFGGIAGLIGQTSSYPIDVIRRRLQTASAISSETRCLSALRLARLVISSEGIIRGLYKGLTVNWIKGPIAVGISFTTFDTVNNWLERVRS